MDPLPRSSTFSFLIIYVYIYIILKTIGTATNQTSRNVNFIRQKRTERYGSDRRQTQYQ